LLRNPWPKRTAVQKHCFEPETDILFSIFRDFFSPDFIPKATNGGKMRFFIHTFTEINLTQQFL
jgi:hypothetical protein